MISIDPNVPTARSEWPFWTGVRGISLCLKVKERPYTTHYQPMIAINVAELRGCNIPILSHGNIKDAWHIAIDRFCDATGVPRHDLVYANQPPGLDQMQALRAIYDLDPGPSDQPIHQWQWSCPVGNLGARPNFLPQMARR